MSYQGPDVRRCQRCGASLGFSYAGQFCEKCSKEMVTILFPSLKEDPETVAELIVEDLSNDNLSHVNPGRKNVKPGT